MVVIEKSPEDKQTTDDNQYLEIVNTSQGDRTIIVPSPWGYRRVTARCPYDVMGPAMASCGDLAGSSRLSQRVYDPFLAKNDNLKSCVVLTITLRCPYGDRTLSLRCVYGLRAYDFFKVVIVRS